MNELSTYVLYHSADFDGIFSREIARHFMPHAELIGWNYGDPVPALPPESLVYMIDICIDEIMTRPNLIWIDHHASAINKWKDVPISGLRVDGVAACRLAWQWFTLRPFLAGKESYIKRELPEPDAVRLAGEYDVADYRDHNVKLFQYGLRSMDLTPTDWKNLLAYGSSAHPHIGRILERGRVAMAYALKENEALINRCGFTAQFQGLTVLACNSYAHSDVFKAKLTPEHDACMVYYFTGKEWAVSLYRAPGKEHIDLSEIASHYGGGGHKGACGFKLPMGPVFYDRKQNEFCIQNL